MKRSYSFKNKRIKKIYKNNLNKIFYENVNKKKVNFINDTDYVLNNINNKID
jgi:hypothetical protein